MIRERAAELFAAKGYSETSMQDIATAVGVMKGTLYHFYKTKELLLFDVLTESIVPAQKELDGVLSSGLSDLEKLEAFIRVLVRYHRDLQSYMVVFTREDVHNVQDASLREQLLQMQRRFEETWEVVIGRAMTTGGLRNDLDHRVVAFGVIGMINWMYKWYSPSGRVANEVIAETFSAVVLQGLLPRNLKGQPGQS